MEEPVTFLYEEMMIHVLYTQW